MRHGYEVLCDGCNRALPMEEPPALSVGPLHVCLWGARTGACQSCGSLPDFPLGTTLHAGNCAGCWRLAMDLPRGACTSDNWPEFCPVWPGFAHRCGGFDKHRGAHVCTRCGLEW